MHINIQTRCICVCVCMSAAGDFFARGGEREHLHPLSFPPPSLVLPVSLSSAVSRNEVKKYDFSLAIEIALYRVG